MVKFNKLDVPLQWKDEFTKYPHGYTIFEALCKWVKQVDNMVDNINNWNAYLDNFVKNFEFELQEEVQSTVERWQSEGLLDAIIESALNTELDNVKSQLAETVTKRSTVLLCSHRASEQAPENSIIGLTKLPRNVNMIEIDVYISNDNIPFVIHDATLDRTTDGTGVATSFSMSELKQLDAGIYYDSFYTGVRIPTLVEMLHTAREQNIATVLIDLKDIGTSKVSIIKNAIVSSKMGDRCIVMLPSVEWLNIWRTGDTDLRVGLWEANDENIADYLTHEYLDIIFLRSGDAHIDTHKHLIPLIKAKNIRAGLSIVQDTSKVLNVIKEQGIDVIMSDRPSAFTSFVGVRGNG